jgi:hypothetical protein
VNLAIWLAVGIALVAASLKESATVTLTDAELAVESGGRTVTVARGDVSAVFRDGAKLVVLDRDSRQLVRDGHRAPAAALAEAFRAYGYPWLDADPHADRYRRWTPGTADLPPAVNAVLAAREVALRKKDREQAAELRGAVEELGFVLRDDGTGQLWRPLVRP